MKTVLRLIVGVGLLFTVFCGVLYRNPLWVVDQQIRLNLWRRGVRGKYIEAGRYRVHYFEAKPSGSGPGTPLILIHGLGSRGEDWGRLIPELAASGFHVYVPDLVGYGRSPQPDIDYSITTEEDRVVEFMKAAGIAKADVGGWSMGGWVAAKLTLDRPEVVDRLVVYDSAGIYFRPTFDTAVFTPRDAAGLRDLTALLDPHPPKLPRFLARAVVQQMQANAWVIDRSVAQMVNGRDLLDFRLADMQRPTLVVWGSRDDLIPLAVGESMHRSIPDSSMTVIDGCGHLAPGQCWHSALATTVDFLKAEPAPRGVEHILPGD